MYKLILFRRIRYYEDINMFIKIRRDTLIILLLAFILILCGRLITYVAFASSTDIDDGIPMTSKREVSLQDAIQTAQEFATRSTVPGTSVEPITAADVQVDKNTGVVTVTVIEDFSSVELNNQTLGVG